MLNQRNRKKQTALITGASSGIGLAYAKNLARRGYDLVLISNEKEKIFHTAGEIASKYGIKTHPLHKDLSTDNSAEEVFDFCRSKNIEIEILISNAGFLIFDYMSETDTEKIKSMVRLQTETPTLLCKLFGDEMKKRRQGFILLMSSMAAWMPYPGLVIYASTKRYLKDFAKAFHYEMADFNVGVTALCPGAVNTSLYKLDARKRDIALKYGIMMPTDKLADMGIRAMFRKKTLFIPGRINRIALPLLHITPMRFIQYLKHRTRILDK